MKLNSKTLSLLVIPCAKQPLNSRFMLSLQKFRFTIWWQLSLFLQFTILTLSQAWSQSIHHLCRLLKREQCIVITQWQLAPWLRMKEVKAQKQVLSLIKEGAVTRLLTNLNSVRWQLNYSRKSEKSGRSQNSKLVHPASTKTIMQHQNNKKMLSKSSNSLSKIRWAKWCQGLM